MKCKERKMFGGESTTSSSSASGLVATKSTFLLRFDGSKENFEEWWEKVKLLMTLSELDHLFDKETENYFPAKENEATGAAQKKLVRQNKIGMARVRMTIDTSEDDYEGMAFW